MDDQNTDFLTDTDKIAFRAHVGVEPTNENIDSSLHVLLAKVLGHGAAIEPHDDPFESTLSGTINMNIAGEAVKTPIEITPPSGMFGVYRDYNREGSTVDKWVIRLNGQAVGSFVNIGSMAHAFDDPARMQDYAHEDDTAEQYYDHQQAMYDELEEDHDEMAASIQDEIDHPERYAPPEQDVEGATASHQHKGVKSEGQDQEAGLRR